MHARRHTEIRSHAASANATVYAERNPGQVASASAPFPLSLGLRMSGGIVVTAPPTAAPPRRGRQVERARTGRRLTVRTPRLKRATDIVGASVLLVLTSPIMLIAAILVRLTSPGPVIFRQIRTGINVRSLRRRPRRDPRGSIPCGADRRDPRRRERREVQLFGRPFVLYKFRTMCVDAEKNGPQLAKVGDPRVTRVGRVLRRTRIDELPQLWNVLRGDMSLIGPRPERPELIRELSEVIPTYLERLEIKPGLTGLAQVRNGYDTSIESFRRKVQLDIHYLRNWSIWTDLKILWMTLTVVITGKGAC